MTDKDKKILKDARQNGTPVFILTAKDLLSLDALYAYYQACANSECSSAHIKGVEERWEEFADWRTRNHGIVKLPD